MSTTTATTTRTLPLSIQTDYALHHSGSQTSPSASTSQISQPAPQLQAQNPLNWPTNHRRIPPHRPINRTLDFAERSAGASLPEYIFIQSMLHGVWINASMSRLWRFTGGRVYGGFRYDVGGEY